MCLRGIAKRLCLCLIILGPCRVFAGRPPESDLAAGIAKIKTVIESGKLDEALKRLDSLIADLSPGKEAASWLCRADKFSRIHRAWRQGHFVCFRSSRGGGLRVLDTRTGESRPLVDLSEYDSRAARVAPGGTPTELVVVVPKRIMRVDMDTRQIETRHYPMDLSREPLFFENDYIGVRTYMDRTICRISREGQTVWECRMPGYINTRPAVFGPTILVQTRKGSSGGQATSAIDMRTGKMLWSKVTNAYGYGSAFSQDGTFLVEAIRGSYPGSAEGCLIGRDAKSGRRLWQHCWPGTLRHSPVIGNRNGRALAVLDTGAVVCLKGVDGSLLWHAQLPGKPSRLSWTLHEDRMVILDETGVLRFIDTERGSVVASAPLVTPGELTGRSKNYDRLVATPWIIGDNVIVASQLGIRSFRLQAVLHEKELLEVVTRGLRARVLLQLGRVEDSVAEVAFMATLRPDSAVTLEARADLCRIREDADGEIAARLSLMSVKDLETDGRVEELTGILKRVRCGCGPTGPVRVGDRILVGNRDGNLRAYQTGDLSTVAELKLGTGITQSPTIYDRALIFPTADKHVCGASGRLQLLFRWPVSNLFSRYVSMRNKLVSSSFHGRYARVAVLELEGGALGPTMEINCSSNAPVLHDQRLYYPAKGGGSTSYDGAVSVFYPPKLEVADYQVSDTGEVRLAFGSGGVYEVDEHLRPSKRLISTPARALAATVNAGAVGVLSEDRQHGSIWRLEAWTRSGAKLPLMHQTPRYRGGFRWSPRLLPFGEGFLMVGRDLVYVAPREKLPVWRLAPDKLEDATVPKFRGPVVLGDKVFVTHSSGFLYMIQKARMLGGRRGE